MTDRRRLRDLATHHPGKYLAKNSYDLNGQFFVYGSNSVMGMHSEFLYEGPLTVLARIGSNCGAVRFSSASAWVNNNASAIKAKSGVEPRWLHAVLEALEMDLFTGGTGQPFIRIESLLDHEVEVPSRAEQSRIAEVLGALDDRIEVNRRLRKVLGQAAQALVESSPAACLVSDLAIAERVQWYPQKSSGQVVDHYSLPAFDASEEPERVEADSIASNKLLIGGPRVLFSRLNPGTNRTWLSVPSDEVDVSVCSTEYAVLAPRFTSVAQLWAALSSGEIGAQLAVATTGTSASHQRINEEAVLTASIPDPRALEEHETDAIEAYLATYLEKGRESKALREARDFLLPRLVSGELRVAVVEELAEAAL